MTPPNEVPSAASCVTLAPVPSPNPAQADANADPAAPRGLHRVAFGPWLMAIGCQSSNRPTVVSFNFASYQGLWPHAAHSCTPNATAAISAHIPT